METLSGRRLWARVWRGGRGRLERPTTSPCQDPARPGPDGLPTRAWTRQKCSSSKLGQHLKLSQKVNGRTISVSVHPLLLSPPVEMGIKVGPHLRPSHHPRESGGQVSKVLPWQIAPSRHHPLEISWVSAGKILPVSAPHHSFLFRRVADMWRAFFFLDLYPFWRRLQEKRRGQGGRWRGT